MKRGETINVVGIETRSIFEARFEELFGYRHAVLFGRARSAIAALLEIQSSGGTFVVPSNISPILHVVGHDSGWKTRLCPVDPRNGLASDAELAEIVRGETGHGLVMPTHLYGFVQEYPETLVAAKAKGWFVLENDTLATKARLDASAPQRAFGDALVVTFSGGKTIEAGGGGAILTDDTSLARDLARAAAAFPPLDRLGQAREEWMLSLRLHLRKGFPGGPSVTGLSEHLITAESQNLRYGFATDLRQPLSDSLSGLKDTVMFRRDRADAWRRKLERLTSAIEFPPVAQPVPWRFVCRVPRIRDRVASALRAAGIDAGINYPPLTDSFPTTLADQVSAAADQWGREVLNLWLTPDYDDARMDQAADIMEQALS